MRSLTHQIAGVELAAVTVAAVDAPRASAAVLVGAAWFGSLLPDADLAGARVYRRTRFERRVPLARLAGMLLRLPVRLALLLGHRGPTHSLLACALATALTGVVASLIDPSLAPAAASGTAIGYGAHIAADALHALGRAHVGAVLTPAPVAAPDTRPDQDRRAARVPQPRAPQHATARRRTAAPGIARPGPQPSTVITPLPVRNGRGPLGQPRPPASAPAEPTPS